MSFWEKFLNLLFGGSNDSSIGHETTNYFSVKNTRKNAESQYVNEYGEGTGFIDTSTIDVQSLNPHDENDKRILQIVVGPGDSGCTCDEDTFSSEIGDKSPWS
ncbi:MAG: hypothetical protein A2Y24_07735 [Clostridiales bacterium GWE2_32_10]|nr:MAG: hypothetical protein A2Y24_07735 [Clostridiales bacterium GWE2_32_10]HBY21111.1 hypothetical protein [Clostridiales bacterium]